MSKKNTRKPRTSSNVLPAFIIGILVATAIIIAVLAFMNTHKTTFKKPESSAKPVSTTAPTEILTPSQPHVESPINIPSTDRISPEATEQTDKDSLQQLVEQQPEYQNPQETPKESQVVPTKPSPEDILNNRTTNQSAQIKSSSSKRQHIIQAGAFNDKQSAEEQRAKLAIIGINMVVNPVELQGKTVYRVQTELSSDEQAKTIITKLKQNKISYFDKSFNPK